MVAALCGLLAAGSCGFVAVPAGLAVVAAFSVGWNCCRWCTSAGMGGGDAASNYSKDPDRAGSEGARLIFLWP